MKNSLFLMIFVLFFGCQNQEAPKNSKSEPLNIIFMIGDGMGLPQVTASFYFKESASNFRQFKTIGLSETSSTSHKITDSAAGATAFSTGEKTYKRAIGVSKDTVALPTLVEQLEGMGYQTGLISLTSITHATPASFYAHVKDRDMHEEIAGYLLDSQVDFFAGGGLKYFNKRSDGRDLYGQLASAGYQMDSLRLPEKIDPDKKYGFLLADDGIPSKPDGRRDYLQDATRLSLNYFSSGNKPFFVMIEGSYIDWGGHAKDADLMVSEVLDFDKTIGIVQDFVENHPNTLLIVTADHETGGVAIGKYYRENPKTGQEVEVPDSVAVYFTTDQHTTELVPVFAQGRGESVFSGVYENNEIFHKIMGLVNQ